MIASCNDVSVPRNQRTPRRQVELADTEGGDTGSVGGNLELVALVYGRRRLHDGLVGSGTAQIDFGNHGEVMVADELGIADRE